MARPARRAANRSSAFAESRVPLWVWAVIVGSLALIIVAVVVGSQPRTTGAGSPSDEHGGQQSQGGQSGDDDIRFDVARRVDGDVTAIGDVDAPVVIVEYSDYRCPFCAVVSRDTLPKIIDEYVETGKVRFEWRDFPIFGEQSVDAAVAGRAAGEQGLFWEYNEAIYAEAPARSHIDLPRERLIEFAEQVGVPDIEKFTADLDNQELLDAVNADAEEASSIGVSSTPIFVVGNTPVVGAQPYEAFVEVIESELAKADQ